MTWKRVPIAPLTRRRTRSRQGGTSLGADGGLCNAVTPAITGLAMAAGGAPATELHKRYQAAIAATGVQS